MRLVPSIALLCVGGAAALLAGQPRPVSASQASYHRSRAVCASVEEAADERHRQLELERLEACLRVANLERRAEQAEAAKDLPTAIEAYEELLTLQPPTSPGLREEDASRRALQELLLESCRRELVACGQEGCEADVSFIEGELRRAQKIGEESRKTLAARALDDVGRIRNTVVRLLELTEEQARQAAERAAGEQSYQRLVEGMPGWLAGWQLAEATRRMDDARLLRKSVEADLNRLELQLLQGDPSLAFIRDVLKSTRNEPLPLEENSLWLREQFESGALPRDPEMLRVLLDQARTDPERVVRLVTQAKDHKGRDLYTRRANDRDQFQSF